MLTRRDIATLSWYGVLFSAIVLWANWRPSGNSRPAPRLSPSAEAPDHVDEQQEMRRIMQRMMR